MWPSSFQKARPDLCFRIAGPNKNLPDRCRRLGALFRVAPQQLHRRNELAFRLSYSRHVLEYGGYDGGSDAVKLAVLDNFLNPSGTGDLSMRSGLPNPPGMMVFAGLLAAGTLVANAASAQQASAPERPELLSRLVACRSVTAADARLACYDAATGALDSAERQGEVVVVDRAQVSAARRQLFGFELPSITLFDSGPTPERIDSVETTLARASSAGDGKWTFVLADGGTWRQIDSDRVSFRNTAGQPVRVRRATLGSYLLTVGDSRAVRVRRQ